jgi:hypothetical protein
MKTNERKDLMNIREGLTNITGSLNNNILFQGWYLNRIRPEHWCHRRSWSSCCQNFNCYRRSPADGIELWRSKEVFCRNVGTFLVCCIPVEGYRNICRPKKSNLFSCMSTLAVGITVIVLREMKKQYCLVVKNKTCVITCIFTHPEPSAELGFVEFLPNTRRVRLYATDYRHNKRLRAKDDLPAEIQLHVCVQNVHWNVFLPFLCKRHHTCNFSFQFNSYSPLSPTPLSFWTCFSTPIHPHLSLILLPKYFLSGEGGLQVRLKTSFSLGLATNLMTGSCLRPCSHKAVSYEYSTLWVPFR